MTTAMQAQTPSHSASANSKRQTRRWSHEEHARFLRGLEMFPHGPWSRIAALVGTRTTRQTMTHAQKYRERMVRRANEVQELWLSQGYSQTPNPAAIQDYMVAHPELQMSTSDRNSSSDEDLMDEICPSGGASELDELDMRILMSLLSPDTEDAIEQLIHEPTMAAMELEAEQIDNTIWSLLSDLADVPDEE